MATLLVTRPEPQATAWTGRLRQAGVDAVAVPLLAIEPPPEPDAVQQAWRQLDAFDGAMFVSPAAVATWMQARPAGAAWPASLWAAAPGPGTAQALRAHGVGTILEPAADADQFDSESLWAAIGERPWQGRSVLVVHGGAGRPWLSQRWHEAGATVRQVQAYQRRVALPSTGSAARASLDAALNQPTAHAWLFSSGEIVDGLASMLAGTHWRDHRALCTHPAIAERAHAAGFGRIEVVKPQVPAIALLTIGQP